MYRLVSILRKFSLYGRFGITPSSCSPLMWRRYIRSLGQVFQQWTCMKFQISWLSSLLTNCLSCVAMDPTIRAVGALSLWSVEIVMQIRIYALFGRSKRIAIYNGVLFLASIAVFIWVMIFSAQHRRLTVSRIASKYRLPGCPAINGGIRWAVWVPGTLIFFGLTHFELTTV